MLNFDYLLAAGDRLGLHDRLGAGFKISCAMSLRTHALHCVHHVGLLGKERISHVRRPLDVARHPLNHVWKFYQRLDAWVPRLLCHCVRQRFAFQILVSIHPLLKLDNFKRIRGSSERLSQERIWIESDRCNQRVQLIIRKLGCLLCVRSRRVHHLRLSLLRRGLGINGREQPKKRNGDDAVKQFFTESGSRS